MGVQRGHHGGLFHHAGDRALQGGRTVRSQTRPGGGRDLVSSRLRLLLPSPVGDYLLPAGLLCGLRFLSGFPGQEPGSHPAADCGPDHPAGPDPGGHGAHRNAARLSRAAVQPRCWPILHGIYTAPSGGSHFLRSARLAPFCWLAPSMVIWSWLEENGSTT